MATGNIWAQPNVDPKRSFRWLLTIGTTDMPSWVVTKVSQPSFEVSEHEHQFINHKFYYPGRVTWSDVSFTLVDPVSPDAALEFQQLLSKSGYAFPNEGVDTNVTDTPSKSRARNALGVITLELYGESDASSDDINHAPVGTKLGSWKLTNGWVKSVTHSELSYESEEFVNAEVTVRYDWAQYTQEATPRAAALRGAVTKAGS